MSISMVILIVAVVAILALVLLARDSGPRITHIETRRDRDEGDADA